MIHPTHLNLIICEACDGDGIVPHLHNEEEVWTTCMACAGTGEVETEDNYTTTLFDLLQPKEQTHDND